MHVLYPSAYLGTNTGIEPGCCLQECLIISSGIDIAVTFIIKFIDKNACWCLHVKSTMFYFVLNYIYFKEQHIARILFDSAK